MPEILPAIIPESFSHLHDEVAKVKDFVNMVQVDITDGIFVKNRTWPYVGDAGEFEKLVKQNIGLPFWEDVDYEFHLMIESPEKSIEDWIQTGASGIIIQVEGIKNPHQSLPVVVSLCKAGEVSFGLSIKPSTDNSTIAPFAGMIDFIQCMGSDDLGHHGALLDQSVFGKISQLRESYPELPIAIDIGVNEETARELVHSGATKLISGGAIFDSPNIPETIKFFRNL